MRCLYCEVEVTAYPENGICPQCGGSMKILVEDASE